MGRGWVPSKGRNRYFRYHFNNALVQAHPPARGRAEGESVAAIEGQSGAAVSLDGTGQRAGGSPIAEEDGAGDELRGAGIGAGSGELKHRVILLLHDASAARRP